MIISHDINTIIVSTSTVFDGRKDIHYILSLINQDNFFNKRIDEINLYKLKIAILYEEDKTVKTYKLKDLELLNRNYKIIYDPVGGYTRIIIDSEYKIIRD